MTWVGGVILFSMFFFLVLLIILPRGIPTQAEAGEVEPGTPAGAPSDIRILRKFFWAALAALVMVLGVAGVMAYELITMDDLDFMVPESLRSPAHEL